VFSALSYQVYNGTRSAQCNVLAMQRGDLRDARTCIIKRQQHGRITTTPPMGLIRCSQQRVNLFTRERVNQPAVSSLHGNRQDPSGHSNQFRVTQSEPSKERANVTGSDGIMPIVLQAIEERQNQRGVPRVDFYCGRFGLQLLVCVLKEEAKGVAITAYCLRTDALMLEKVLDKEPLQ
jgi:hypothetical protein